MLSYQDYVNKIRKLRKETQESITELEDKVLKDLEDELSKYLKVVNAEDINIEKNRAFELVKTQPDKIFLLSDDYGCILSINQNDIYPTVSVYTLYKHNNVYKYIRYARTVFYTYQPYILLENEVKNIVSKLKKENDNRIQEKERRELKIATKKYNL